MKNCYNSFSNDWVSSVPKEVWHKFEDFGYFPKDIDLYDALGMAQYILLRMHRGDYDDYYTWLAKENPEEYLRIKKELEEFTAKYPLQMREIKKGKRGGRL